MAYNFSLFSDRAADIQDWLKKEFSAVRTGKASPLILDSVLIDSYGAKTPLKHVATIMLEDARTLRVSPWDRNHVKGIESAIAAANLGVSTSPDSAGVRVIFPELTSERRQTLLKLIKEKVEEAKVSLRKEREKVIGEIETQAKNKEISEDDKFKFKEDLQKLVEVENGRIEALGQAKEEEISK